MATGPSSLPFLDPPQKRRTTDTGHVSKRRRHPKMDCGVPNVFDLPRFPEPTSRKAQTQTQVAAVLFFFGHPQTPSRSRTCSEMRIRWFKKGSPSRSTPEARPRGYSSALSALERGNRWDCALGRWARGKPKSAWTGPLQRGGGLLWLVPSGKAQALVLFAQKRMDRTCADRGVQLGWCTQGMSRKCLPDLFWGRAREPG